MKINTILIGLAGVLFITLVVMGGFVLYKKNITTAPQTSNNSPPQVEDPALTNQVTPYIPGTGSLEKEKKTIMVQNNTCSPQSITIPAPAFMEWKNSGSEPVTLSDPKLPNQSKVIPANASLGQFFSDKGTFTYQVGSSTCTVTVQ